MSSVEQYVKAESRAVLGGDRLLPPKALAVRWGVSERTVRSWADGRHPAGMILPAFKPSPRVIRFRLRDVLEFEHRAGLGEG